MKELRAGHTICISRKLGQQGAVLVEMAFALPILAIILISIIDLGIVVREFQLLQNAVREGARFSARQINQIYYSTDPCATESAIKAYVINYAAQENIAINPADITVNQVYPIPGGSGSEITAAYQRNKLLLGAPFFGLGPLTIRGRSVFENFYGPAPSTLPAGTTCP